MSARRALFALVLLAALPLLGTAPASAHSELLGSTPAADSVLDAAPDTIVLTFNQNIQPEFLDVTLTDTDATNWILDSPTVVGAEVKAPVDPAVAAGRYTVAYRVLSADGHPITGSFSFTIAAVPPRAADGGTQAAASPTAAPDATPAAEPSRSDDSGEAFTWLFGAAAAGLVVAGIIVVFRGRRGDRT